MAEIETKSKPDAKTNRPEVVWSPETAPRETPRRRLRILPLVNAGNKVPARQPQMAAGAANLRHVANRRVAPRCRPAEHTNRAIGCRHETQDSTHRCRLARTIWPEHADELATRDLAAETG
jgi:hypothetical protein